MKQFDKIFQPFTFGHYNFKNRVGLAAMTRCRADPDGTPNDIVKSYYVQRSESAGFMSTEAMGISPGCNPWGQSCNVFTKKSVEKWKDIISAVHKNGSYIFAQLVHGGRVVHSDYANGVQPMAPSLNHPPGEVHTPLGKKPYEMPREMNQNDINKVIADFKNSIINANEAGFDGIEFHGANGYLIDQFLRSGTNQRTDKYGGSVENRCRFLLELIDMAKTVISPNRIGVKISPVGAYNSMHDDNPQELTKYLLTELQKKEILYVVMGEPDVIDEKTQMVNLSKFARQYFKGLVISDGSSATIDERRRRVEEGECDIANFGKAFFGNPDLTERLKNGWPLNPPQFQFMYNGGAEGYSNIPKYQPK